MTKKELGVSKAAIDKYADFEKYLCADCKRKIVAKLEPVQESFNSDNKFKKAWATAKLASLQLNLWRSLCPTCLRTFKHQVGVKK